VKDGRGGTFLRRFGKPAAGSFGRVTVRGENGRDHS
jgi:hypothetical protein